MQITGKTLLNQAESILKERKQDESLKSSTSESEVRNRATSSELSAPNVIESRILNLQENLAGIQKNLSREQARQAYLSEQPQTITDKILYDGKPLFPEAKDGWKPEEIKPAVENKITSFLTVLKQIQVEMENLFALKFESPDRFQLNAEAVMHPDAMKDLNPDRVAKLTR